MPNIKDIKKIKFNDEYVYFGPESIVSEIADSMDLKLSLIHISEPTRPY